MRFPVAALLMLAASCSTTTGRGEVAGTPVTGVVEVLSRDGLETIILTETISGEVWILTGDISAELRDRRGQAVTVLGVRPDPPEDGSGRPLLEVVRYTIEGEEDQGGGEP